jgi:putative uncharacterized protein (fragment)
MNTVNNSQFYENVNAAVEIDKNYRYLKQVLKNYIPKIGNGTIYIVTTPLYKTVGSELYNSNEYGFVIMIPNSKILFTSINSIEAPEFEDYVSDFEDELVNLSINFKFAPILGTRRQWKKWFEIAPIKSIDEQYLSNLKLSGDDVIKSNLLISLITGSINDPNRVPNTIPSNILEAVKKRIIQFDGDQTRFIYDAGEKNIITIQGLAGTGKTELLLHRLVNLYVQTEKKIVYTCFNRILANDIKKRIPDFFDYMKVSERSELNERIKVMRSWGSSKRPEDGVYSYICNYYGLDFIPFGKTGSYNFEKICEQVLQQLDSMTDFEPCFDYILIDEAQDFSDLFFKLCEKVSSEQIIIAGDIFQNIYERSSLTTKNPDFTLNKVYRNDPRNFMFSQFLGFGLKEIPVIKWLTDDAWYASGYVIEKHQNKYTFSRQPLLRFSDINGADKIVPTKLFLENNDIVKMVIQNIAEIKENFEISPEDLGIIFLSNSNQGYRFADLLSLKIKENFNWDTQKIYEELGRTRDTNKVFISNKNNVKGLEFPFIICVVLDKIDQNITLRNTLYMMMTRSFITSYLVLSEGNKKIYDLYNPLLSEILENHKAVLEKPSEDEIMTEESLNQLVEGALTLEQKISRILNRYDIYSTENIIKVKNMANIMLSEEDRSQIDALENLVTSNKELLKF